MESRLKIQVLLVSQVLMQFQFSILHLRLEEKGVIILSHGLAFVTPNAPNANMAVQQFFVWTGSHEKKSN